MTTVQISYDVNQETVDHIESMLERVAMYDPSWNGAEFKIERGESTCITDSDSYDAAGLLNQIQHEIADFENLIGDEGQ